MAELTPELAPQVVEACTANAEEAAGAIGRAFDGEFVLKATDTKPFAELAAAGPSGAGLVFAFKFGEESMVAALPAAGGLVPDWAKSPDPTGESKLSTLGQELSMLLVPDTLMADSFEAVWSEDLAAAVGRAEPGEGSTAAPIELAKGEALGQLTLVWPVANADAALKPDGDAAAASPAEAAPEPQPVAAAESPAEQAPSPQEAPQSRVIRFRGPPPRDYNELPPSVRTALQVLVPVSVNLASKKVSLNDVVELGPGAIITFDKSCEEAIEVSVGDIPVATAEAVKVGDRFGVRVQSMILPEEHFRPLLPPRATG